MQDQITIIVKNIGEYKKEIKTLETMTENPKQRKRQCEF